MAEFDEPAAMNTLLLTAQETPGFWPQSLAENWLALAAAAAAVFAFFHALHQYQEGLRWKRARFLGRQYAKFRADPKVAAAFALLDQYDQRSVVLFPDADDQRKNSRVIAVTQVVTALAETDPDNLPDARDYDAIRDCFDAFFDGLEGFECYLIADVIDQKHLANLLEYWVRQFADGNKSKKGPLFVRAARGYVMKWYPGEVQNLCHRFGCGFPQATPAQTP